MYAQFTGVVALLLSASAVAGKKLDVQCVDMDQLPCKGYKETVDVVAAIQALLAKAPASLLPAHYASGEYMAAAYQEKDRLVTRGEATSWYAQFAPNMSGSLGDARDALNAIQGKGCQACANVSRDGKLFFTVRAESMTAPAPGYDIPNITGICYNNIDPTTDAAANLNVMPYLCPPRNITAPGCDSKKGTCKVGPYVWQKPTLVEGNATYYSALHLQMNVWRLKTTNLSEWKMPEVFHTNLSEWKMSEVSYEGTKSQSRTYSHYLFNNPSYGLAMDGMNVTSALPTSMNEQSFRSGLDYVASQIKDVVAQAGHNVQGIAGRIQDSKGKQVGIYSFGDEVDLAKYGFTSTCNIREPCSQSSQ